MMTMSAPRDRRATRPGLTYPAPAFSSRNFHPIPGHEERIESYELQVAVFKRIVVWHRNPHPEVEYLGAGE